jgi:tight adherence protein B
MMIVAIILFTAVAVGLFVVTFSIVFGRREAVLERRLAGYELVPAGHAKLAPGTPETAIMQQAVDLTGRFAERAGFLTRVEHALERGDVPIRASELMFYTVAATAAGGLLFALLLGPLLGLVGAAVIAILPMAYVSNKQRNRTKAFERQLPDTLTLLASSLRAGFSFMQGLETVSQEIGEPMRRELQRVFTEVRLGRQVEDALGDAAERMKSKDLAWTVMAIKIQREVGGNLAVLLDTVADTMLKRERIRREVRALTAEGRMSAIVLALVPPLAAVGLLIISPDYITQLFDYAAGWAAVIGAVFLMIVGGVWLQKLVDIEV